MSLATHFLTAECGRWKFSMTLKLKNSDAAEASGFVLEMRFSSLPCEFFQMLHSIVVKPQGKQQKVKAMK